jgi:DNA-binding FadR family transcriptional regulator
MARQPARAERLHQSVARAIGTGILTGRLAPGEGLGGEIEQSLAMGVSRTAYREAIRILIAKGLLESRPKVGTRVTDGRRWNLLDPDILAWTFSGDADEGFIRELFELRTIIEPEAAALAALRRTDQHLAEMDGALAKMAKFGFADARGQAADQRFHRCIIEASGNRPLGSLAESVGAAVSWTTRFKQRLSALPRNPMDEHRAVFVAIRDGNAGQARAAMGHLITLALKDMNLLK